MKKMLHYMWKGALGIGSAILTILSFPPVRNFIWKKTVGKGQQKVVDAKAKVVKEEDKKKLFS
ncbi:MAG: hypothetical protein ABIA47_00445 [bacterium]